MARKKLLTEGEVRQFMKLANLGSLSETYLSSHPLREQPGEEEDLGGAAEVDQLGALEDEEMALGDEEMALDDEVPVEGGEENEELLARVVRVVADELGVEADIEGAGDEEGGEDLEVAALDVEDEEPLPGEGAEELDAMGVGGEPQPPGSRGGVYERKKAAPLNEVVGLAAVAAALAPLLPAGASMAWIAPAVMALLGGAAAAEVAGGRKVDLPDEPGRGPGEEELGGVSADLAEDAVVAEVSRRVAQRLMQDKQKEEMAGQLAERIFDRLTQK